MLNILNVPAKCPFTRGLLFLGASARDLWPQGHWVQRQGGLSATLHQSGDKDVTRRCESPTVQSLEPQGHRFAHTLPGHRPGGNTT